MMIKPTYKKAVWISERLESYVDGADYEHNTPDNVLDVLIGQITLPHDFVEEVLAISDMYDEDNWRHNAK